MRNAHLNLVSRGQFIAAAMGAVVRGMARPVEHCTAETHERETRRAPVGASVRIADGTATLPRDAPSPADGSVERVRLVIHRVARRLGLHPLWAEAMAIAESNLNPNAVSPTGCCVGLFQINRTAARELGILDLRDPEANADAGIRYYLRQLRRFRSTSVALVAFNAGPEVAQRWRTDSRAFVPVETQRYVKRVINLFRALQAAQENMEDTK